MKSNLATLSQTVNQLEETCKELKAAQTKIANYQSAVQYKPLFTSLFNSVTETNTPKPPSTEEQFLHAVRVEQLDSISRECNILLMGVASPEEHVSTDDKVKEDNTKIHNLFTDINIDPSLIKKWYRFKKTNSIHEPVIKVELYSEADVTIALRASRGLRVNQKYSKVYINPDLTPAEREAEKVHIAARKEANL